MYKTVGESLAFARELLRRGGDFSGTVICPTLPALYPVAQRLSGTEVGVGAQNLDVGDEGAMTGATSAYLLREAGSQYVIVGHSERRQWFGEDDALVAQKVIAAREAGLRPILCVGESPQERQAGQTDEVVTRQLSQVLQAGHPNDPLVVAYEPVWAIGTGLVPQPQEAQRVALVLRQVGESFGRSEPLSVLYGGSVNRANVASFAEQSALDGLLVGGASLDVGHWLDLIQQWKGVRP